VCSASRPAPHRAGPDAAVPTAAFEDPRRPARAQLPGGRVIGPLTALAGTLLASRQSGSSPATRRPRRPAAHHRRAVGPLAHRSLSRTLAARRAPTGARAEVREGVSSHELREGPPLPRVRPETPVARCRLRDLLRSAEVVYDYAAIRRVLTHEASRPSPHLWRYGNSSRWTASRASDSNSGSPRSPRRRLAPPSASTSSG